MRSNPDILFCRSRILVLYKKVIQSIFLQYSPVYHAKAGLKKEFRFAKSLEILGGHVILTMVKPFLAFRSGKFREGSGNSGCPKDIECFILFIVKQFRCPCVSRSFKLPHYRYVLLHRPMDKIGG